jgi:hypothetical protein
MMSRVTRPRRVMLAWPLVSIWFRFDDLATMVVPKVVFQV